MQISDAEWTIMNFVWRNQPVEASGVMQALGAEHEWSDGTIKTMLHRLVKKGALATEAVGKKFRYRAAVKNRTAFDRQVARFWIVSSEAALHQLSCISSRKPSSLKTNSPSYVNFLTQS